MKWESTLADYYGDPDEFSSDLARLRSETPPQTEVTFSTRVANRSPTRDQRIVAAVMAITPIHSETSLNTVILERFKELNEDYFHLHLKVDEHQKYFPNNEIYRSLWRRRDSVLLQTWIEQLFPYQAAVSTNRVEFGLLHSVLRHSEQWIQVLPGYEKSLERIPGLIEFISSRNVNVHNAEAQLSPFSSILCGLLSSRKTSDAVGEVSRQIYDYLYDWANPTTYMGERMNQKGQVQIYFRTQKLDGSRFTMAICPSQGIYNSPDGSNCKFRKINTVFFVEPSAYDDEEGIFMKLY